MIVDRLGIYKSKREYTGKCADSLWKIPPGTLFEVTQINQQEKVFYSPTFGYWHKWEIAAERVLNHEAEFIRYTKLHENGDPYLPLQFVNRPADNDELVGDAVERLALYEGLLKMEPAQAALYILELKKENAQLRTDWERLAKFRRHEVRCLQAEEVEAIRKAHPKEQRVEIIELNDPYAFMPPGLQGAVDYVDDAGNIHVTWDNGSRLPLIYGVDTYKVV